MLSDDTHLKPHHSRLFEYLKDLSEDRSQPTYILEGVGCGLTPEQLLGAVRSALATHPPQHRWWRLHYLPLLFVIAEHGYLYEGASTEFWPPLEAKLRVNFSHENRTGLSELHRLAQQELGIAEPPTSPWASQFCHIAWPITHAVLPRDLQRSLVRVLASLPVALAGVRTSDEVVSLLRMHGRGDHGPRFEQWLTSPGLVQAISSSLLGKIEDSWLEPALLQRIQEDLEGDLATRPQLEVARRIQEALTSDTSKSTPASSHIKRRGQAYLRLDCQSSDPQRLIELLVELPSPSAEALRLARKKPTHYSLWGLAAPAYLELLFSGVPLPIHLEELPALGAPLIGPEELEELPEPLREEIATTGLELQLPLVFEPPSSQADHSSVAETCLPWCGDTPDEGVLYVLHEAPGPQGVDGIHPLGNLCGATVFKVSFAKDASRAWFEQTLGKGAEAGELSWIGGPVTGTIRGYRSHESDPCVWLTKGAVSLKAGKQGSEFELPDGALILNREPEPLLSIGVIGSGESEDHSHFVEVHTPLAASTVELSGPQTIQGLVQGELKLLATGDQRLEALELLVSIEDPRSGESLSTCQVRLGQLPSSPPASLWRELVSDDLLSSLLSLDEVTLRVNLGSLTRQEWRLDQAVFEYTWSDDLQAPIALNDEGELPVLEASGEHPLRFAKPEATPAPHVVVLRTSKSHQRGYAGGRCAGEREGALKWAGPSRPDLKRRLRGEPEEAAGLLELFEAYLGWTLATPTHMLAELRRQEVVKAIEGWSVEVSCGATWLEAEQRSLPAAQSAPWQALVKACRQLTTEERSVGFDGYLTVEEPLELKSLDEAISRRLRQVAPHLGALLGSPLQGLTDSLVDVMNWAFNEGYRDLRRHLEDSNPTALTDRELEPDAWTEKAEWIKALQVARRDLDLAELAELLWPRAAASSLANLDYELLALPELAEALSLWSKDNRQALQGESWPADLTLAALQLWSSPSEFPALELQPVVKRMLVDRGMSRACRYVATRSKLAREQGAS